MNNFKDKKMFVIQPVSNGQELKEAIIKWTNAEDFLLVSIIASYGTRDWEFIAELVNAKFPNVKRTVEECRERWQGKLDISATHSIWSKEEEAVLILLHMKFKNNWCAISNQLKKRHNDTIKNRFYSIFRRVRNRLRNYDLSQLSEIELYETYYILSLMEEHLRRVRPLEERKRKRAKSFIYKLVEGLDIKNVKDYEELLYEYYPLKEPLKDCLEKIADGCAEFSSQLTAAQQSHQPNADFCVEQTRLPIKLPEPHSYLFKEPLTHEEKESITKQCFSSYTVRCERY